MGPLQAAKLLMAPAVAQLCLASGVREEGEAGLSSTERDHMRGQSAFRIGEGFEGSASDWTEYVVWLVGVIGVFYYMMSPKARHVENDEPASTTHADENAKSE